MFIELVGSLRCVRAHELTWLVASAYRMEDRDIVSGELGCHVCGARYSVERGVADFRELGAASSASVQRPPGPRTARDSAHGADPAELAIRVAALLDLTSPGGLVVLAGEWSAAAIPLSGGDVAERVQLLTLDPDIDLESGGGISIALTGRRMPVRPAAARGIALDESHSDPDYVASAAEALRPGARLLAPVAAQLPPGLSEIARDERFWLASKGAILQTATLKVRGEE
jgi:hypothetical protein